MIFDFLRKPSITAKLVTKGQQVKVNFVNINEQNALVLLFLMIKQVASFLKIEHRQLLNDLKDLDTQMKKSVKIQERKVKYSK